MILYTRKLQEGGKLEKPKISQEDSTAIVNKLNKDPLLSSKYKYIVETTRKEGDILYRVYPDGRKVFVNHTTMSELNKNALKHKIDQDLIKEGKKPIYNIFTSNT